MGKEIEKMTHYTLTQAVEIIARATNIPITHKCLRYYCYNNQISGACKVGRDWVIPDNSLFDFSKEWNKRGGKKKAGRKPTMKDYALTFYINHHQLNFLLGMHKSDKSASIIANKKINYIRKRFQKKFAHLPEFTFKINSVSLRKCLKFI